MRIISRGCVPGALALALLLSGSASLRGSNPHPSVPVVLKAEPEPDWEAKFAGGKGWIGGDGVYSVILDSRRVLWFFGDTILGEVKDGRRINAVMVNNTIGIQNGLRVDAAIRFAAGQNKEGKAAALLVPAEGTGWFWPQAGVCVEGRLFVFLAQVKKTKQGGAFGFRHIGQWLAVVDNPQDDPKEWRIKQHKVPFAAFENHSTLSWGSAVLEVDGRFYVYGYEERGKKMGARRLLAARVPVKKLDDFSAWRFCGADGWSARAADAVPLADGLATEFSVSRMPNTKGFVAVYTENGLGDRIMARFAGAAEGPWSAPLLLYRCPEMAKDKGVFSYAAKAHPWAVPPHPQDTSRGSELLISYCVNTWEFARLFKDAAVYRPKFVRVKLKRAN